MKQKDLAVLAGVLIASIIVAIFVSKYAFGSPDSYQKSVEVVDKISPDFPVSQIQGKDKQFNSKAIDPTQFFRIGNHNEHPFTGNDND